MQALIIELIYTQEKRGKGMEGDPVRLVDQYYTKDGKLVFEKDSWADEQKDGNTV